MPRVSAFYGIVIAMHWRDHYPAHFHAIYAGREAQVEIATLEVLAGSLPPTARRLVREWGSEHRAELEQNWRRVRAHQPLASIEPLR